jgi:uncharacterized SAM-binding protein YcdF (DUF218 family)
MNQFDVICILSNEIDQYGKLSKYSKQRAEFASKLFFSQLVPPKILVMGDAYRKDTKKTMAESFKNYLITECKISSKYIIFDKKPRDTVGEAVFSFKKLSKYTKVKHICVITHKIYYQRQSKIFKFIYNDSIKITFKTLSSSMPRIKLKKEMISYNSFKKTFSGIKKGDIENIYKRMIKDHPYYNGNYFK